MFSNVKYFQIIFQNLFWEPLTLDLFQRYCGLVKLWFPYRLQVWFRHQSPFYMWGHQYQHLVQHLEEWWVMKLHSQIVHIGIEIESNSRRSWNRLIIYFTKQIMWVFYFWPIQMKGNNQKCGNHKVIKNYKLLINLMEAASFSWKPFGSGIAKL